MDVEMDVERMLFEGAAANLPHAGVGGQGEMT